MSGWTLTWLVLGLVGGALFYRLAKSFGRAQNKVLAQGLVIAAVIYVFFALPLGLSPWLLYESLGALFFAAFAWLGVRRSAMWLAAGWALHPVWDAGLHWLGPGAGIAPHWYVVACLSFDVWVGAAIFIDARRRSD